MLNCLSCINATNNTCDFKFKCKNYSHYGSSEDFKIVNDWYEKTWRDGGGLVVCDYVASECCCNHAEPHKYTMDCKAICQMEDKHVDCIAYNPKPEDEMIDKEYVVVKDISLLKLSNVDFKADIFKELFRCFGSDGFNFVKGDKYKLHSGFVFGAKEELERLGFIEEAVRDYVVEVGDCFSNGSSNFMVQTTASGFLNLVSLFEAPGFPYNKSEIQNKGKIKLSELTGEKYLKDFKPVKIKISEVE